MKISKNDELAKQRRKKKVDGVPNKTKTNHRKNKQQQLNMHPMMKIMSTIVVQLVVVDIEIKIEIIIVHQDTMMIDIIVVDVQKGIDNQSYLRNLFLFFYRSPEKEFPLLEEETVQFNPNDVVLDFCK
jgi:hypothetical protein